MPCDVVVAAPLDGDVPVAFDVVVVHLPVSSAHAVAVPFGVASLNVVDGHLPVSSVYGVVAVAQLQLEGAALFGVVALGVPFPMSFGLVVFVVELLRFGGIDPSAFLVSSVIAVAVAVVRSGVVASTNVHAAFLVSLELVVAVVAAAVLLRFAAVASIDLGVALPAPLELDVDVAVALTYAVAEPLTAIIAFDGAFPGTVAGALDRLYAAQFLAIFAIPLNGSFAERYLSPESRTWLSFLSFVARHYLE